LAIAQCGAPTAALNASLDGVLRAAAGKFDVLGIVAGPAGLAAGALQRLDPKALLTGLPRQPGAWLGAGRHPWDQASLAAAAGTLRSRRVTHLVLIRGGEVLGIARRATAALVSPRDRIPAPEGVTAGFRRWIEPLAGSDSGHRISERTDPSCAPE
jgi:6-phosphofructokinase